MLRLNPLISYILWTKVNCKPYSNISPKSNKESHVFAEGFNIVIQTYQPGFSDLIPVSLQAC